MFRTLLAAALLAAAPASVPDDAAVTTALFDTCPKVLAGALDIEKPADLAAIGYAKSAPRGKAVWARRGEGQELILLAQVRSETGEPGARSCSVTFTDDANHARFATMEAEARGRGFRGPPAGPMGNAPKSRMVRLERDGMTLMMVATINHIELGNTPSTMVLIVRK